MTPRRIARPALKVLWPEFSRNDKEMQRFIRAMKTMLPLRHANLITLYGAGKSGGYCWIAMEFVDGESLKQVIQRIGTAGMLDWRAGDTHRGPHRPRPAVRRAATDHPPQHQAGQYPRPQQRRK